MDDWMDDGTDDGSGGFRGCFTPPAQNASYIDNATIFWQLGGSLGLIV
jgi:hypothetical protein